MNNKPKLNKYTEDLLSAKRLPLPLREFIISYGGVKKLRTDIWGRYYGEEMVRQKEKGKTQERAERAANRYCQGIMLEMAWKAGYIEERRLTERKVEKKKAVFKEKETEKVIEYRTTTNLGNEISTDHVAVAVNENVNKHKPQPSTVVKGNTKHEEKTNAILKAADGKKMETVVAQVIKQDHKPETTVMAVDALPASTVYHIIPPGEFNPSYWNRGSKYVTHVLTFVRPEAAVGLFQRLAVRSSELNLVHMENINKVSPTSAIRVFVQLPLLFPVSVPLQKLTSAGMANISSKERREIFGPLPSLVKRERNTGMSSLTRHSLSELADVQIGVQMDTNETRIQVVVDTDTDEIRTKDDTNDGTAPKNIAYYEMEKKNMKSRIGKGIRKFFRRLCVCGRKEMDD